MKEHANWNRKLKDLGIKTTKHRIEIIRILEHTHQPISADTIYEQMKTTDILISLSTVYRTLDTLIENGLIRKIQFDNESKSLYEINHEKHQHHFVCIGCNKIITLKECPIKEIVGEFDELNHLQIVGHKLEFYGYCEECQRKNQ